MTTSYATEQSFRAYIDYLALKKHFTSDGYDYHKYNGKVKASFDNFSTRKDTFFFYKLSQKKDWHNILLANIVKDGNIWIRDVLEEKGEANFAEWEGRMDALTYTFKEDLSNLKDDYASNFASVNGQHPYLMTLYMQKKISLETFTILTHISKVHERWSNEISDKVIAKDLIRLTKKYYPFLQIDQKKFSEIIKNRFF